MSKNQTPTDRLERARAFHAKPSDSYSIAEVMAKFADAEVADAQTLWLYELSEMWAFSKDSSDFLFRFKPWLDAKCKEFDERQEAYERKT
jgi:hypothetical protein